MAGEIVHIEIPADDTAKGREFWGSLFGWQFEAYPGEGPSEYHMTRIGDQMVSEVTIAVRASGNSSATSSAMRSTPGPQATRLSSSPHSGHGPPGHGGIFSSCSCGLSWPRDHAQVLIE